MRVNDGIDWDDGRTGREKSIFQKLLLRWIVRPCLIHCGERGKSWGDMKVSAWTTRE